MKELSTFLVAVFIKREREEEDVEATQLVMEK